MDAKKRLAAFKVDSGPAASAPPKPRQARGKTKGAAVRDNDGAYEPLRNNRPVAQAFLRAEPAASTKTRPEAPPEPDIVSGSDSDPDGEIVDVAYIHAHKPSTAVVRKFVRVQAQAISAAEEDDFM